MMYNLLIRQIVTTAHVTATSHSYDVQYYDRSLLRCTLQRYHVAKMYNTTTHITATSRSNDVQYYDRSLLWHMCHSNSHKMYNTTTAQYYGARYSAFT